MADVINLADRAPRLTGRRDEAGPCEAVIILFTGVRYERLTDGRDSGDSADRLSGSGRTNPPRRAGGGKGKKH